VQMRTNNPPSNQHGQRIGKLNLWFAYLHCRVCGLAIVLVLAELGLGPRGLET